MEFSHIAIMAILLGCMATYVPVFMCLFFTAVLGFRILYRPSGPDAGPEHISLHG